MSKKYPPSRPHEEVMVDIFRDDPEFAIYLLNDVLRDGDSAELLMLLRQLTKAFGGVHEVAVRAKLNAKSLYRSLSGKGNPEFRSLTRVLEVMGLRLMVESIETKKPRRRVVGRKTRSVGAVHGRRAAAG